MAQVDSKIIAETRVYLCHVHKPDLRIVLDFFWFFLLTFSTRYMTDLCQVVSGSSHQTAMFQTTHDYVPNRDRIFA